MKTTEADHAEELIDLRAKCEPRIGELIEILYARQTPLIRRERIVRWLDRYPDAALVILELGKCIKAYSGKCIESPD
jgi:hypothetical protein